ncbi:hypothetical protein FB471_5317 [Amycolatopsis cihanbeyliensis]|uniref:Tat pathway signal sequence n=1 Tax=Amycolatopsis cihanbeyliensis TaxID=1128664 RepID=A0A542DQV2_AMYCI|nr:hypothetical protein FB471_5317 [Amycolatopsis cihanbeyliensis]
MLLTLLTGILPVPAAQASTGTAGPRPAAGRHGLDAFDPELRARIVAADRYARGRPGFTGIVVRDRRTGAVWRNADSATLVWACSTPKLAMVVDLLVRADSGAVDLTVEDRALMRAMLHSSDNDAAHTLWNRHGGEDIATRFPDYGMTDMRFTDDHPHHWGWILTTTDDLDRLVNHALERMPVRHRDYIVHELRSVAPNQQWGVWGAGTAAMPGNKNGWADDNADGSWLMNSVGFAGPDARYTLAMMNNTKLVDNGYEEGKETTTRISEILFAGYFD